MPGPERSLIGLNAEELAAALETAGIPSGQVRMRARQLWNWLYVRGASDFAQMTNLAKDLRANLSDHFALARPEIVSKQISTDGTRKWLVRFGPGVEAETVYIPDEDRGTLCVSSQVGCTLNCSFCHTGTQKLVRNLTATEILSQILIAKDDLDDWPKPGERAENRQVTNIVMMGMGEPLYNFENVKSALLIASEGDGIGLSKRRITLSTAGVVPQMPRISSEIGVMLAVSLHAVRDDVRDVLVPLNKKYPIAELMEACRTFPGLNNATAHHFRVCDAERRQ